MGTAIFVSSSLYLSYHTYWAQQASVQMQTSDTIVPSVLSPTSQCRRNCRRNHVRVGLHYVRRASVSVSCPTSQSHCQLSDKPVSVSAVRQASVSVSCPTSQCQCQLCDKPVSVSAGRRASVSCPTSQCQCQLSHKPVSVSAVPQARVSVSCPTSQSQCQLADKRLVNLNNCAREMLEPKSVYFKIERVSAINHWR